MNIYTDLKTPSLPYLFLILFPSPSPPLIIALSLSPSLPSSPHCTLPISISLFLPSLSLSTSLPLSLPHLFSLSPISLSPYLPFSKEINKTHFPLHRISPVKPHRSFSTNNTARSGL